MTQPIWFKQLELGPMQNYVYLLGDPTTREAAVVDAAWDIDAVIEDAEAEGYRITHDLVTHFHPDHLGGGFMGHNVTGAAELVGRLPVRVVLHKAEIPFVHRITGLSDSDVLERQQRRRNGGHRCPLASTARGNPQARNRVPWRSSYHLI